jgi:hypothetical protein
MTRKTKQREIAEDYCKQYNTWKDLTLARKIYKDHADMYKDVEHVRNFIRVVRGHIGEKSRNGTKDKSQYKPPAYDCSNSPKNFKEEINTSARVLIIDIETAPLLSYTWGIWQQNVGLNQIQSDWFMLTWAAKWLFEDKVYSGKLTAKEAKAQDDGRITKGIWELVNQADIVIAHNCVEKSTPVLKADMTWVPAGDLVEGDELLAFEEDKSKNSPRKIKKAVVTSNFIETAECYKVTFDNGDEVITTGDHKWLKLAAKGRDYRWCETQNLEIGQRVEKFFTPWEEDRSYEAAWLSGFISGEGTLRQSGMTFTIDFCQRQGVTLDQAVHFCEVQGYELAKLRVKSGGLGRGDTYYTNIKGGKFKTFETLGKLKIKRLINNIKWDQLGAIKSHSSQTSTIISIERVGGREVAVLSTSTKTFFAAGYPMHNCEKFDVPKLNSRFIINGLQPPLPYQTIDTLKHIRRQFGFTSNKLEYVQKLLNLKRKTDTGGMGLWIRCMQGEEAALTEMETYNVNDVRILEETYLHIRAWIKPHPNMGLFILDETQSRCPACGSADLKAEGKTYQTSVNAFELYRCGNCGSSGRKRVTTLHTKQRRHLITPTAR